MGLTKGFSTYVWKRAGRKTLERVDGDGARPIIMVDGYGLQSFTGCRALQRYNATGDYKWPAEALRELINTFKDQGYELVFFFDGHDEEWDEDYAKKWVDRNKKRTESFQRSLEGFGDGSEYIPEEDYAQGRIKNRQLRSHEYIDEVAEDCGCQCFETPGEADSIMAAYAEANKKRIYGIIGCDSDLFLFPDFKRVINSRTITLNRNTKTIKLNEIRLENLYANVLQVEKQFLFGFAVLLGNDYDSGKENMTVEKAVEFLSKIDRKMAPEKLGDEIHKRFGCDKEFALKMKEWYTPNKVQLRIMEGNYDTKESQDRSHHKIDHFGYCYCVKEASPSAHVETAKFCEDMQKLKYQVYQYGKYKTITQYRWYEGTTPRKLEIECNGREDELDLSKYVGPLKQLNKTKSNKVARAAELMKMICSLEGVKSRLNDVQKRALSLQILERGKIALPPIKQRTVLLSDVLAKYTVGYVAQYLKEFLDGFEVPMEDYMDEPLFHHLCKTLRRSDSSGGDIKNAMTKSQEDLSQGSSDHEGLPDILGWVPTSTEQEIPDDDERQVFWGEVVRIIQNGKCYVHIPEKTKGRPTAIMNCSMSSNKTAESTEGLVRQKFTNAPDVKEKQLVGVRVIADKGNRDGSINKESVKVERAIVFFFRKVDEQQLENLKEFVGKVQRIEMNEGRQHANDEEADGWSSAKSNKKKKGKKFCVVQVDIGFPSPLKLMVRTHVVKKIEAGEVLPWKVCKNEKPNSKRPFRAELKEKYKEYNEQKCR